MSTGGTQASSGSTGDLVIKTGNARTLTSGSAGSVTLEAGASGGLDSSGSGEVSINAGAGGHSHGGDVKIKSGSGVVSGAVAISSGAAVNAPESGREHGIVQGASHECTGYEYSGIPLYTAEYS